MMHVFTIQSPDGSYPEVGMTNRWPRTNLTPSGAARSARLAAKHHRARVRVQSWVQSDFYKGVPPVSVRYYDPPGR